MTWRWGWTPLCMLLCSLRAKELAVQGWQPHPRFVQLRLHGRCHTRLRRQADDDERVADAVPSTGDPSSNREGNPFVRWVNAAKHNLMGRLNITAIPVRAFVGGAALGCYITVRLATSPGTLDIKPELRESLELFNDVLYSIDREYVDEVAPRKLFDTAVTAMLRTLDPYTEFEEAQAAQDVRESVSGQYAGVGLVIASERPRPSANDGRATTAKPSGPSPSPSPHGVLVVSAFEKYAFEQGVRVGDRILAVDGVDVATKSLEDVRNLLRGDPDTTITVTIERQAQDPTPDLPQPASLRAAPPVNEAGRVFQVDLQRKLVRVSDVKLATVLQSKEGVLDAGPPVGFIQLTGFSQDAGPELLSTIARLQSESQAQSGQPLSGLVLDLRGNPGGLLNSAVEVSSLLVPQGSSIVSANGRGFQGTLYKSNGVPARDPNALPLAVLVNSGTASAAEIVSGAVQDLDVGVIVGDERTFGKGLVQNVESLPYNTALKYTVAKYYTPSGRCIQSVDYNDNGVARIKRDPGSVAADEAEDAGETQTQEDPSRFSARAVKDQDRRSFRTKVGRVVRDGGGVEPDVKVAAPQLSLVELLLTQQGTLFDYATKWTQANRFDPRKVAVTDAVFSDFKRFVAEQLKEGGLQPEVVYAPQLGDVERTLTAAKVSPSAVSELGSLRETLRGQLRSDIDQHEGDVRQALEDAIRSRYLPESVLRRDTLPRDLQVKEALAVVRDRRRYDALLAPPPDLGAGDGRMVDQTLANLASNGDPP